MLCIREVYIKYNKDNRMQKQMDEFEILMVGYLSDSLTSKELKRLKILLKKDTLYVKRYDEIVKLHAKSFIPYFEQQKRANYLHLSKNLGFKRGIGTSKKFWLYFRRIAAVVALIVPSTIATYYIHKDISMSNQNLQLVEMEVPPGSQTKAILPDSSVVFLNSGSILKYDISYDNRKTRDVYLSGEGYFEVKRNEEKPFTVHIQDLNVKVLGTFFNVRAYLEDPEIEVNLLEGSVNVYTSSETDGNIILSPNEHLVYNKMTKKMWSSKTDAALSTQWIIGRISFVNTPLLDIIKEIEQKYNVGIDVRTEKMKSEIFSGSISTKLSVDEMLNYIDVDKKYRYIQEGNTITIVDK